MKVIDGKNSRTITTQTARVNDCDDTKNVDSRPDKNATTASIGPGAYCLPSYQAELKCYITSVSSGRGLCCRPVGSLFLFCQEAERWILVSDENDEDSGVQIMTIGDNKDSYSVVGLLMDATNLALDMPRRKWYFLFVSFMAPSMMGNVSLLLSKLKRANAWQCVAKDCICVTQAKTCRWSANGPLR
eukprot:scaffold12318_cov151-Amphora_coffeaeformis.AAC.5